MRCRPEGPTQATIAIVGEAPGKDEELLGLPFVGASGGELGRMLRDAGIVREACFITNLTHDRPPNNDIKEWISDKKTAPDSSFVHYRNRWVKPHVVHECERLYSELRAVSPNVVITLGNSPLWALCSQNPVSKWRGSQLVSDHIPNLKVIPTYHPAFILRAWKERWITVQDFRRAKREAESPLYDRPIYNFALRPTLQEARALLWALHARLDRRPVSFTVDLEIFRREVLCVGIGTSAREAFCIPFLWTKGWYWAPQEHTELVGLLRKVLTHPNARVINQNLSFDIQYLFWRFMVRPKAFFDTMIAQNLLYSGLPKDLAFLASMYCDNYVYWKDDGKFWEKFNDEELWKYNCLDCTYTYEIWEKQHVALISSGLTSQMDFQMEVFDKLMAMMLRGVRVDHGNKVALLGEVETLVERLHDEVQYLSQSDLRGPKGDLSPQRLADLFYTKLALPPQYKQVYKDGQRKSVITCEDEALIKLANKHNYVKPLTNRINMIRSYGTAIDVLKKRTDPDHRWRTSYNVAGTTTYRLSSSENPLDSGLNLQNLTIGKDITK